MTEIAGVFIAKQPTLPLELCPQLIEEQKRDAECAAFLALRIADMAKDLEVAFDAAMGERKEAAR